MLPAIPSPIPLPFAQNGERREILENNTVPGSADASWATGFPPVTRINKQAGGKPPFGLDFQGIFHTLSAHAFYSQSGGVYPWVGAGEGFAGLNYLKGAHVLGSNGMEYLAGKASGPDVPASSGSGVIGPVDPVGDTSGTWHSLAGVMWQAFATCETAGSLAQKEITLGNGDLFGGKPLYLTFANVNSAENPTLAVNGGEAKPILWQGMPPEVGALAKGQVYHLIYSGTAWQIMGGLAPWNICQTVWFEDTLNRPGFAPLNGGTISNFAATWPQAAAYLATTHGQARCFTSLADRNAAHVAIWHTLASGATVGWGGFGGVCKFFHDAASDTLYLPDLRGMFRAMAGDGIIGPGMGGVMGDRIRQIEGTFGSSYSRSAYAAGSPYGPPSGIIYNTSYVAPAMLTTQNEKFPHTAGIDSSRTVPPGATNAPRSWGALACAYLGQQNA